MTDLSNITLNIAGLVPDSIVDGPGLRFSVFVQGCDHDCPSCHNPKAQDREGGREISVQEIVDEISKYELISGATITGGEPFDQPAAVAALCEALVEHDFEIWVYSGYLYEQLIQAACEDQAVATILETAKVLVDGPYVEELKDWEIPYRGSSNQRIIDLSQSLKQGRVVLWEDRPKFDFARPASW